MTRTTGNKLSGVGYGILHFILVIALLGISCTIGAFGLKYYLNCHSTMVRMHGHGIFCSYLNVYHSPAVICLFQS